MAEEVLSHEHHVPAGLLELYEILEWKEAVEAGPRNLGDTLRTGTLLVPGPGTVVSRAGWGARQPKEPYSNLSEKRGSTGHYEGPHMGPYSHDSCATKVRGIQAFHMDGRGWNDIAYTTLTCIHGVIFMGRGWNARTAAQGTNQGNATHYAHCVLIGVDDDFTHEAQLGLVSVFRKAQEEGGAGTERKVHSDWHPTGCPGDPIRDFIRSGMHTEDPNIPDPPSTSTGSLEESQVRTTVNVRTDADGNGWKDTSIPWSQYRGCTAQGLDPEDAKRYGNAVANAHNRNSQTRIVVTGGVPTTDPANPNYVIVHVNRLSN